MNYKILPVVFLSLVFVTLIAAPRASAANYKVLYSFAGVPDGSAPYGGLVFDQTGRLYGTTSTGGDGSGCGSGCGTIFELARSSAGWSDTVLYSFSLDLSSNGYFPLTGLVRDGSGNLYGVASGGDNTACDCGVVYELSPSDQGWTETIIHTFEGTSNGHHDGANPQSGLISDSVGNLYGTTYTGGVTNDIGTVYELSPAAGGGWSYSTIYSFNGLRDGQYPWAGLAIDSGGNLYGTTTAGGSYGAGTVFELSQVGGIWNETTLYHFTGGADGGTPISGVMLGRGNNIYGTTKLGGAHNVGAIYRLAPVRGNWVISILYSFTGGNDGGYPGYGSLSSPREGTLYGTTEFGGFNQYGTVFTLYMTPADWQYKVLHSFTGGQDGAYPFSGVVLDSNGNLYGSASGGGIGGLYGNGVVYEVRP